MFKNRSKTIELHLLLCVCLKHSQSHAYSENKQILKLCLFQHVTPSKILSLLGVKEENVALN